MQNQQADSSISLLVSVIKQLSSENLKQRQFEKEKLEDDLKKADVKLTESVDGNQDNIKQTIHAFGIVSARIKESKQKVALLRDKLLTCKSLLHCNRDDLKKQWQEGLEYTEILLLLDRIDSAMTVPERLDRFLSRKHFLHATDLLVKTVDNLESGLSSVEALRDLRQDLSNRKSAMHELLIEELNKQIYAEAKLPKTKLSTDNALITQGLSSRWPRSMSRTTYPAFTIDSPEASPVIDFAMEKVSEDLQMDPEENLPQFINILAEALFLLNKIPEAIESLKTRIKREMALVILRISDQVALRAVQNGYAVTTEELATMDNPSLLLELHQLITDRFRLIANNHFMVISAFRRVKDKMNPQISADLAVYSINDVWSEIEFSIRVMLRHYLDVETRSAPQQALSSFANVQSDMGAFFAPRKRGNSKSTKYPLFRFEGSSSAQAMSSYMREQGQDLTTSIPDDPYTESLLSSKPQLLCKPNVRNITVLFIPLMQFVEEIEVKTSSSKEMKGILYHYITDYIKQVFLKQVLYEVTDKTSAITHGREAMNNVVESGTSKSSSGGFSYLKSTVVMDQVIEELGTLMRDLPMYANDFLDIIVSSLKEYAETCHESYQALIQNEDEDKQSRIISASWVHDEDMNRYWRSLPNWIGLQEQTKKISRDEEENAEVIRARNAKEANQLTGILKKGLIAKNEVILNVNDLKALANLQASLEWFTNRIRSFNVKLMAKVTTISIQPTADDEMQNVVDNTLPSIKSETSRALGNLAQEFQELAETCLLVLHLEIRCHCFYFLMPATRQSSFYCPMDAVDIDPMIPQLTKDLRDIEEIARSSLAPSKCRYLFEGIGYLLSSMFISSTAFIPKINRNGVKKMCQMIFTIQQELTCMSLPRDPDLDLARQYFELLYLSPDDLLNLLVERGPIVKEIDYANAITLLCKSEIPFDSNALEIRKRKLRDILVEWERKRKDDSN